MWSDFKAFIAGGNVLDLAVGVMIGGAFATIIKSLTDDLIMPVVGAIFGGVDFSSKYMLLGAVPEGVPLTDYVALKAAGVPMLGYGAFITAIINFLIFAFVIFMIVRWVGKVMRNKTVDAGPTDVELLTEIRDELRKR